MGDGNDGWEAQNDGREVGNDIWGLGMTKDTKEMLE